MDFVGVGIVGLINDDDDDDDDGWSVWVTGVGLELIVGVELTIY